MTTKRKPGPERDRANDKETAAANQVSSTSVASDGPRGLDPALLIDDDFVLVRMALVDKVGLPAAVVLQRIAWRCEIRAEGYRATLDDICAETRLGKAQVKAAIKRLRGLGWLTSRRASSWDPTQVWSVVTTSTSREVENRLHVEPELDRTSERKSTAPPYRDVEDVLTTSPDPLAASDSPDAEAEAEEWWANLDSRVRPSRRRETTRLAARLLAGVWTVDDLNALAASVESGRSPAGLLLENLREAIPSRVVIPDAPQESAIAAVVRGAGSLPPRDPESERRKEEKLLALMEEAPQRREESA